MEELVGDQDPDPKAPPRSRRGRERREQKNCQGRSDCQRSDGEGWGISRSLRGEEVRKNNPVKYSLPGEVGSSS